ncbi:MAG: xanthine phosphoribosyltransferase, partial [Lactobacillus johnsonii]|nr:xanthine phosphoribosyltransferase [Lactobacillus johnsonii]
SEWVKDHGYRLEALARIADFENNQVHFVGEE